MVSWQEDAYVTSIFAILNEQPPEWGIQPDGRSPWWVFVVSSPRASSFTEFHLVDGQIVVGIEGIPGNEKPSSGQVEPLAIEDLIDSDMALAIARENGAVGLPTYMSLNNYDRKARREIPLSWMMFYEPPDGGVKDVYVNAFTGEVVGNEFAGE
jgi:hypothetical protein